MKSKLLEVMNEETNREKYRLSLLPVNQKKARLFFKAYR